MLTHHLLVTLVDDARPARAAARAARVDVGRLFLGLAIRGAAHEEMWGRGKSVSTIITDCRLLTNLHALRGRGGSKILLFQVSTILH